MCSAISTSCRNATASTSSGVAPPARRRVSKTPASRWRSSRRAGDATMRRCDKVPDMLPSAELDEAPVAESEEKTAEPPLFKVLLHNDDYTTMEFVVWVLESVFNMPEDQAFQVMLNVHVKGVGVAGVYTYEIAEMKVAKTTALAQEHEFPLLCTMEKA